MTPFLRVRSVSKSFGAAAVLRGVSLDLERGECVALLGASGCGKSTLLNIVQGLLSPDSGSVECEGKSLSDVASGVHIPMRLRRFATVFQDFSLWPHMTAAQNVGFGLRIAGVPRRERQERIATALRRVGLEGMERRRPDELSGGQQQRIAIARAMVVEPRLLLLDEPLSALDARLREELRDDIARLIRETGMTAIYVTHDQAEAFAIAHRVAVMRDGDLEQIGSPTEIYQNPATGYVAGFIGASNIFRSERTSGTGSGAQPDGAEGHGPAFVWDGVERVCGQFGEQDVSEGLCALRRESVRIEPESDCNGHAGPGEITLRGVCERTLFRGETYETVARTDAGLVVRGLSTQPPEIGRRVAIRFSASSVRMLAR